MTTSVRTYAVAPDHASWVPGSRPAPRDFAVLLRERRYSRRGELDWWPLREVLVPTREEAGAVACAAAGFELRAQVMERTKVSPGPIGSWAYSLRSHVWRQDASIHLEGRCLECDAHALRRRSLDQVEDMYRQGRVWQVEWEGYTWAWATGAVRLADYPGWSTPPAIPEAREFGERLKEIRHVR